MTQLNLSRVKYSNLFDLDMDTLLQLKKLNIGYNGAMFYPCKAVIAHKLGKYKLSYYQIKQYKQSIVAYITNDNVIISWALILKSTKSYIREICRYDDIKQVKSPYELHFYTKYRFRKLGIATRIAKSIKRKYPTTYFWSAYNNSSIFVKNNTLLLKDKKIETKLK